VGNTYTKVKEFAAGSGVSNQSIVSLFMSKLTVALAITDTVTLTCAAAEATRVIGLEECSIGAGTPTIDGANGATGNSTTPSVTLSGLASIEHFFFGELGKNVIGEGFTQDADYANNLTINSGGGAGVERENFMGTRVATLTGDTYNPTMGTSRRWVIILCAIHEAVTTTSDVTKSGQYAVVTTPEQVKAGTYLVLTEHDINKAGAYNVVLTQDPVKLGEYRVLVAQDVTKAGEYRVVVVQEMTKGGEYRIVQVFDITKSGQYLLVPTTDLTLSGTYRVVGQTQIDLSGVYRVLTVDHDIVLTGAYNMVLTSDPTKSGEYRVILVNSPTKLAEYRVLTVHDVVLDALYRILLQFDIVKGGTYRIIIADNQVNLVGAYRMLLANNQVVKTGKYVIAGPPHIIDLIMPLDVTVQTQPTLELILSLDE
jgi:hypothetical protein